MATRADCLKVIEAAAAGRLSDDEIETILSDLDGIRAAREAEGKLDGIEQAMMTRAGDIAKDMELAAQIEKRNRLINIVKKADLLDISRRADEMVGDPSLGIEAATGGINAPIKGGRRSVDFTAKGMLQTWLGGMVADLRAENLLAKWNSGKLSREIAKELWDISLDAPTGRASDSADAKAIARIIDKYRKEAVRRENRAGAYIRNRQGYVTRQNHDGFRMSKAGREKWSTEVAPRLNWDAMGVAPADREAFLKSAWEVLVTGVRKEGSSNDLAFAFKGPGNLAKKESASRVLIFKSADDWFEYDQQFGRRSLNEAILGDFQRAAQSTALMDRFGTNPRFMFDAVRSELKEKHRSDPWKVKRIERQPLDWQFSEIDGSVNMTGNHTVATTMRTLRAIQSMAKLGGAFISSLVDPANVAATRRADGRSFGDALTDAVKVPLEGFTPGPERRRAAELLGVGLDGALGDFVSRFAAQDDTPGRISKMMGLFFKLNLLGPWTDSIKRGVGLMQSRDLAMDAALAWGELPATRLRELERYGFDARKWEVARLAVQDVEGKGYMFPNEVDNVRGAPFSGLSERQQMALRDDVRDSLSAYIADIADSASPTPGARERAMLRFGLQPGTPGGELVRTLSQFKAFPITVITKTLGRATYGRGAKSFGDAILRGEGDIVGLAAFIAASSAMGYMAMQAKEVAKGREMRPFTGESAIAGALQGGGLGIYGDFLLGQTSRFGRDLTTDLAGPLFGTASDIDKIRAKIIAGEDIGGNVVRLFQSNTPFANLFWAKTALDYLIFYQLQEMTAPGSLRRMERRMERENGQRYFVPPSSVVPRGGDLFG